MSKNLTSQGVRNLNALGGKLHKKACSHHIDHIYVHDVKMDRDRGYVNILGCDKCGEIIGPETDFEVILPPLT